MTRPLEAGDLCEVIGGMGRKASPNLGLTVTVKHRIYGDLGMDHRELGAMYRCEGDGVCQVNDAGAYIVRGWADFAGAWLRRIDIPPMADQIREEHEAGLDA